MTKWTPGEWTVFPADFPGIECDSENFSIVVYGNRCEDCGVQGRSPEEALANARVMAAAKDLYHALDRIMDYATTGAAVKDVNPYEQPEFIAARAALRKVRGE